MVNFRTLWQKPLKDQPTVTLEDVSNANDQIHKFFPATPLTYSPIFSENLGRQIYFKWDNKLKTGSFKERGALNFLLKLSDGEKKRGVCAASAGNHALALSYYANRLGISCKIVMPNGAPLVKIQSTRATGAEVILRGDRFDEAYEFALELSKKSGSVFVPAFDHPFIIAGQGSCGLEILDQLPDPDAVIVPVGGGGLSAGVATAIKGKRPQTYVLGVQSEWALDTPNATSSPSAVRPVTIADGIAVKRVSELTAQIIKTQVDQLIAVNEAETARAVIRFLEIERAVVEGAGAVGLAALLGSHVPPEYQKIVVIVSGSNIDINLLSRLIERDMAERNRLLRIKVSLPDRPGALHAIAGLLAESGANVLEVFHDRSFSELPANVDISFLLEVRDLEHSQLLVSKIESMGVQTKRL